MARRPRSAPVETYATGARLKWDVRWVVKHKGRWHIIVKPFDGEFQQALQLYLKVKALGRHNVTLRCRNSGFPPPKELQPYWVRKKLKEEIQTRRGAKPKYRVRYKDIYRSPMRKLNREGVWWCPYCMELREFVKSYEVPFLHPPVNGINVMPTEDGLYCPMCLVSTRDHNVRKHNPLAERISA